MARSGALRSTRRSPAPRRGLVPVDADPEAGAVQLDRIIHERLRLGMVSALAVNEWLTFNERVATRHRIQLEEAQYVTCHKSFEGRVPRTRFKLTPLGRRALERYLAHMEAIIRATRSR